MEKGYRHEYKYLISKADAELLKRRLPHIMERDPHAGKDGRYTIRSLYFDDASAAAYYEKVDGLDLGSSVARRRGSSPLSLTIYISRNLHSILWKECEHYVQQN